MVNFAFIDRPAGTLDLDPDMLAAILTAAFDMLTEGSLKTGIRTDMLIASITRSPERVSKPVSGFRFDFVARDGIEVESSTGSFAFDEQRMPARWQLLDFLQEQLEG